MGRVTWHFRNCFNTIQQYTIQYYLTLHTTTPSLTCGRDSGAVSSVVCLSTQQCWRSRPPESFHHSPRLSAPAPVTRGRLRQRHCVRVVMWGPGLQPVLHNLQHNTTVSIGWHQQDQPNKPRDSRCCNLIIITLRQNPIQCRTQDRGGCQNRTFLIMLVHGILLLLL